MTDEEKKGMEQITFSNKKAKLSRCMVISTSHFSWKRLANLLKHNQTICLCFSFPNFHYFLSFGPRRLGIVYYDHFRLCLFHILSILISSLKRISLDVCFQYDIFPCLITCTLISNDLFPCDKLYARYLLHSCFTHMAYLSILPLVSSYHYGLDCTSYNKCYVFLLEFYIMHINQLRSSFGWNLIRY